MKVLQIAAVDFTVATLLTPLIDDLLRQGYTVDIACDSGSIGEGLRVRGYTVHHISFSRKVALFKHLISVWKLVKLIRRENYDCVHAHTPIGSIIGRLAAKIAGVPFVIYTAHGFYFHENMGKLLYKTVFCLEKLWAKAFTDYLFFQSREDYELALETNFKRPDRLILIGNGVSSVKFDPSLYDRKEQRKLLGFHENDTVFAIVCRLVREKGVLEFINAFLKLRREEKLLKLMIIGGPTPGDRDGLSIDSLRQSVPDEYGKDILFMGVRNDVAELLSACDVFVLPSYREGLPRSIIEAMALEKAIIATNIRGCREQVVPEYNGYLCNVKDVEDLAKKMSMLIEQPEKIKAFSKHSRGIYLERYQESKVLAIQGKIYGDIQRQLTARITR